METLARARRSGLLRLIPVFSALEVPGAMSAKAGLPMMSRPGRCMPEMIHIAIQVTPVVCLSLHFMAFPPTGDDVLVVEGADVTEPEEGPRD